MELAEEEQALLDEKLRLMLDTGVAGKITYFQPDGKKDGGAYVTIHGAVKKIDPLERYVGLTNGTKLSVDDILNVEI